MQKSILLVEDEDSIRMSYTTMIRNAGLQIEEAADGALALQKIKFHSFRLVLLDIKMPIVSGIDVLIEINKSYKKNVHSIAFLTNYDPETIPELVNLYETVDNNPKKLKIFEHFIKSMTDPDDLVAKIKNLI